MSCAKCMTGITVSMRVETELTGFSCNVQDANKITTHFEAPFKNILRYVDRADLLKYVGTKCNTLCKLLVILTPAEINICILHDVL